MGTILIPLQSEVKLQQFFLPYSIKLLQRTGSAEGHTHLDDILFMAQIQEGEYL